MFTHALNWFQERKILSAYVFNENQMSIELVIILLVEKKLQAFVYIILRMKSNDSKIPTDYEVNYLIISHSFLLQYSCLLWIQINQIINNISVKFVVQVIFYLKLVTSM